MKTPGPTLLQLLFVFTGAGLGGLLRYGVAGLVGRFARGRFPWATFMINMTGCFVMGSLMYLYENAGRLSSDQRLFWMVGILGGYTTFSTFGYEAETLAQGREGRLSSLYAAASVGLGIGAVWMGRLAIRGCGF